LHDLAVALHLKAVLQRVRLLENGAVDNVAMKLETLALPDRTIGHDLVDVLVVLRAVAQRRVQQTGDPERKDERGRGNLDRFSFHMGLRTIRRLQDTPRHQAGQSMKPTCLSMRLTVARG